MPTASVPPASCFTHSWLPVYFRLSGVVIIPPKDFYHRGHREQWHYFKRCKGAREEASRGPRCGVQSVADAALVVASRPEVRLGSVGGARVEARLRPANTRTFG